MSWSRFVPTLSIIFFEIHFMIGCYNQGEGQGYQFIGLSWIPASEGYIAMGIGAWFHFISEDVPMFAIQLSPEVDACLFWLSPRNHDDSDDR
jgi:hypothetical protein